MQRIFMSENQEADTVLALSRLREQESRHFIEKVLMFQWRDEQQRNNPKMAGGNKQWDRTVGQGLSAQILHGQERPHWGGDDKVKI